MIEPKNISNPKAWARKNKRSFANGYITSSKVEPHDEPAAIFMAGIPGAGKTEFTQSLISTSNLKVVRIDMDELATHIEGYSPRQAYAFREAATDVLDQVFQRTKHRKVDFIMDGTFGSRRAINNIQQTLQKGYTVKVFFIYQLPEVAWEFTKAREKLGARSIDREGFIKTYFQVIQNVRDLIALNLERVTIDVVIKNATNAVGELIEDVTQIQLDKILSNSYNREQLERIIK